MKLHHLADAAIRGLIPFQSTLRDLKRRFAPYEDNPGNSDYCITNGLEQIAALREAGVHIRDADVLEFGTGWLPLIPLLFHLAGAQRLVLTDIVKLMDEHTIAKARAIIMGRIGDVSDVLQQPSEVLEARLHVPFACDYLVPWDPNSHPAASVDIVISRAVFEHVPENELRTVLAQFYRILRPGGTMCHIVDNSDHWQHRDCKLSRVDFLRYEETDLVWRLAQINQQSFQNRLRHSDYQQLFIEAGFQIIGMSGDPDPKCLQDLMCLPLASRFREHTPRDLAVLTSLFVSRKC